VPAPTRKASSNKRWVFVLPDKTSVFEHHEERWPTHGYPTRFPSGALITRNNFDALDGGFPRPRPLGCPAGFSSSRVTRGRRNRMQRPPPVRNGARSPAGPATSGFSFGRPSRLFKQHRDNHNDSCPDPRRDDARERGRSAPSLLKVARKFIKRRKSSPHLFHLPGGR
jgi:hypothetical protein